MFRYLRDLLRHLVGLSLFSSFFVIRDIVERYISGFAFGSSYVEKCEMPGYVECFLAMLSDATFSIVVENIKVVIYQISRGVC